MEITAAASSTSAPATGRSRHPLTWVPSLYLAMGLPNVMVGVVAAIIYKNLGVSNEDIALYTSQMYLPWVLKPVWSPLLEPFKTKRWWVIAMQFTMMASLGLVAFCLPLDNFFRASLAFFWITGFASATQGIVADSVFMTTMPLREQARYAGLQGMCWNVGAVIGSGLLVSLTGWMHNRMDLPWMNCWMIVLVISALMMGAFGLWHLRTLPSGGEGFIEKFGALFMLDPRSAGGLGLDNELLGFINGTVGTLAFIAGAFLADSSSPAEPCRAHSSCWPWS